MGAYADLVLLGGRVITVDAAFSVAEAVAVRGGRIVLVGPEDEARSLVGLDTRVVDVDGGAVLPGINDSHLHALWLGSERIRDPASGAPTTLFGRGAPAGGPGAGPPPAPPLTRADRRRAILRAFDLLAPLGITSFTEPALGPGGDRDQGMFDGAFAAEGLELYAELAAEGALRARVNVLLLFGDPVGPSGAEEVARGLREIARGEAGRGGAGAALGVAGAARGEAGAALPPGLDPRWLWVAGVKVFADGIPPMRTAWVGEPYAGGGHGWMTRVRGDDDEQRCRELAATVALAHDAGLQVGVHATGDRTVDAAVAAFVAAMERPWPGRGEAPGPAAPGPAEPRHYVIHGDYISADTLATMARHRIGLNAQPAIREPTADLMRAAVGERRAHDQWPLRAALDAGVPLCLSSDAPVVTPDWRVTVAAAVLRECGGKVSGPEHRIAVAEALRASTITPAWQDHADHWKGSIEPGKVADLCVLAADPLTTDPHDLPSIPVTMTVLDGNVVFSRDAG